MFRRAAPRRFRVYTRDDLAEAVALLPDDPLGIDRLPVAVFPLDEVAAALRQARTDDAPMKVLLDITEESTGTEVFESSSDTRADHSRSEPDIDV